MSVTKTVRRTQSAKLAFSDSAISFMFRNAWRIRASSPSISRLFTGLMPRMPATNTKSPARAPRLQVPVGAIASLGVRVRTPFPKPMSRRAGLQSESVQNTAHLASECLVDQLVLLDPRLTLERGGNYSRRVVITVAGEVTDRHLRIWNVRLDQPLDFTGLHGHGRTSFIVKARQPYRLAAKTRNAFAES